jgi:8-amino-7-oxononanoate synthase
VATEGPGHITGLRTGADGETIRVARALEARGYFVGAIRPPTVPVDTARLRLCLSSEHTSGQIDGLLGALSDLLTPVAG